MLAEALQIMDNNTIKMMIEEREEKLNEKLRQQQAIYDQQLKAEIQKFETEKQKAETEKQKAEELAMSATMKVQELVKQNAALLAELEALKAGK